jgi:hypothetical protein
MVSKDLKIEIRPIPDRNGIKQFSDNLEYFSQAHIIAPFVNPVSLKYETGLNKEDLEYLKEKNCPYELESNYQKGVAHPFWESQVVKVELKNSPVFLFPGKSIIDFIKWKYLLVNNYIYNSEEEMRSGTKPQATHYIYNESEETSIRATELEKKNSLIRKVGELSLKRKRDIVLIIENENTENKNENYLTVKFDQIMNDKDKALQLEQLLNGDVEDVALSAEIKSAIQKNVLRKTKKGIFYFETNLGFAEEDVKEFLSKPDNQEIYLNIKSKIN